MARERTPLKAAVAFDPGKGERLQRGFATAEGVILLVSAGDKAGRLLSWKPGDAKPQVLESAVLGTDLRLRDGKIFYRIPSALSSVRVRSLATGATRDHDLGTPGLEALHFVYPDGDTLLVQARLPSQPKTAAAPLFARLSQGIFGALALPAECQTSKILGVLRRGEVLAQCGQQLFLSDPRSQSSVYRPVASSSRPVRASVPRHQFWLEEDRFLWPLVPVRVPGETTEVFNLTSRPVGLPPLGHQESNRWANPQDAVLATWPEPRAEEEEERTVLGLFSRHQEKPAFSYVVQAPNSGPVHWKDQRLMVWTEGEQLIAYDLASGKVRLRMELPNELLLVGESLSGTRLPLWKQSSPSELVWLSITGSSLTLEASGQTLPVPPEGSFLGGAGHGWYLLSEKSLLHLPPLK